MQELVQELDLARGEIGRRLLEATMMVRRSIASRMRRAMRRILEPRRHMTFSLVIRDIWSI